MGRIQDVILGVGVGYEAPRRESPQATRGGVLGLVFPSYVDEGSGEGASSCFFLKKLNYNSFVSVQFFC